MKEKDFRQRVLHLAIPRPASRPQRKERNRMRTCRCLHIFVISVLSAFTFLVSSPAECSGQSAATEKVDALYQKYVELKDQGRYQEALRYAEELVPAGEKAFGNDHHYVATFLNNLAWLYSSLGNYPKAEALYKRSLEITEKTFGPEHGKMVTSLSNLALLYQKLGEYAKAEPIYQRALAISEKALGPEHPDAALCLNNLGGLYADFGDYIKAEPLFKRSLAIREKVLGPEHPEVAESLNNLAGIYHYLGEHGRAEDLYKKSLAIKEKTLGSEHPDVASNLNNLAVLYESRGEYAKAEPLYKRSLAIREKALGPNHPDVALSLNNLAVLHQSLGDYDEAVSLCKRSLAIIEKARGPEHPDVTQGLNNLAELYASRGDYAEAIPLYTRSLEITEKAFGREHPVIAVLLNNLGMLSESLGNYANAEAFYRTSVEITEKTFGPEHPKMSAGLNNLAMLYKSLGDYINAEPLFTRSLEITEKAFGHEHPEVAEGLNNLAGLYAIRSDYKHSHELFKKAQAITGNLVDQVMGFTSEDQKFRFLSTHESELHAFLSLTAQHLSEKSSAKKDALDVWLKRKGVILEAQRRFQEAGVYSEDTQAVEVFQELSRVRAQLSKLAFAGPGNESVEAYQKRIAELEAQEDRLEAKLSKLSQPFALRQKVAKADTEKVAGVLPANTVLLEFANVRMFNFKAEGKERKWNPAHYFVFVLHAGTGHEVGMVDLGDTTEIDRAVMEFKKELSNVNIITGYKPLKSCREMYALVFAPLVKELGEVKEIFISPDGNLNLIPFEVLQGPDGRYLIEDYTFNYLAAGRDVLSFGQIKGKGRRALLMGDPDFDMAAEEKKPALKRPALLEGRQQQVAKRSSEMGGLHFTRLPETKEEVETIHTLLGADASELYTGNRALEDVLREMATPRILHLATHGFFLSDLDHSDPADESMGKGFQRIETGQLRKGRKMRIENPLLRSGIALAGANYALKHGDAERSGGIVTAEKILGMKLRGTDMVVLSACETGVGEVQTGEGVFGLRRAFSQAGARSIVMSMWAVPDKETRELMVEFYRNIQSGEMNRCQALRQAVLKEMNVVNKRYGHTNPFF